MQPFEDIVKKYSEVYTLENKLAVTLHSIELKWTRKTTSNFFLDGLGVCCRECKKAPNKKKSTEQFLRKVMQLAHPNQAEEGAAKAVVDGEIDRRTYPLYNDDMTFGSYGYMHHRWC